MTNTCSHTSPAHIFNLLFSHLPRTWPWSEQHWCSPGTNSLCQPRWILSFLLRSEHLPISIHTQPGSASLSLLMPLSQPFFFETANWVLGFWLRRFNVVFSDTLHGWWTQAGWTPSCKCQPRNFLVLLHTQVRFYCSLLSGCCHA